MRAWWVLGAIVVLALVLRFWNLDHGLPYAYNADEELHFVPVAVKMFGGSLNPRYFENPPALTYLLFVVFKLRFGFGRDLIAQFRADPEAAYLTARVVVALIGTLVVGLVYWAGARFSDRRAGLAAAALMAVAFLPVFYSKHALNDVVTMAPVTVALVACLLVYEQGRWGHWILAGAAIGVAIATKYTAGAMLVTLGIAAVLRVLADRGELKRALLGLVVAGAACGSAFALLNPFAIIDHSAALGQIGGQSGQAASGKLGQDQVSGWWYYLRTFTWGLGWIPVVAAAAGGGLMLWRDWRRGLLLVAFPLFLFLFLGHEARFFGRWLLPIYPALCVLAGYAVSRVRPTAGFAVLVVALCAQGLVSSVHLDRLLGREDTRAEAKRYLEANVPARAGVAIEPFVPADYLRRGRAATLDWRRYPVKRPFQAYEKKLRPARVQKYVDGGYCWVVVGSYQKGRGLKAGLRNARAYYAALDAASDRTTTISPYREGAKPVPFSYDNSFNYQPRAYERPGPLIEIHHLRGCS
jgi:4-amino-4-deoxy-L-arabinose transferase-like glycosyltransferase